jgi:hypothetical protein
LIIAPNFWDSSSAFLSSDFTGSFITGCLDMSPGRMVNSSGSTLSSCFLLC